MVIGELYPIKISASKSIDEIRAELDAWQKENKIQRLWAHDATLWTNTNEGKWMGWLDVASEESELPRIEALTNDIQAAGFTDIVLIGMGGSSLFPAMVANVFGPIAGYPRLRILDSTDPQQIRHLEQCIDLKKTLFIVSSKSGSTLEPNILKEYVYARLQTVLHKTVVGDRFIAITDPGTTLETTARKEHFKAIFYGVPSIGGRYSDLSNFGMVPLGLMGVNAKEFLTHAETMQAACSPTVPVKNNPGVILGVMLGVCAQQGKDKVTLIASPGICSVGAWLEQLIAESTGKNGKGLIPIDQEPLGNPTVYGNDRVFIYIRLESAPDLNQDKAIQALEQAGFVIVRLNLPEKMHLGAELFRWQIAVDVASSIMGINPFDQPDVEESKIFTSHLIAEYERTGQLTQTSPFFSESGISLFTDEKNAHALANGLVGAPSISGYLRAHLNRLRPGDYVSLSAFIEMSDEHFALLQESRVLIRNTKKVATCVNFGPRLLHSTGQEYKGGPNTGVFLQITTDHNDDIQIPNHLYTFGLVITAQAQADFSVLAKRSRRVLRVHLGKDVRGELRRLREIIQCALYA